VALDPTALPASAWAFLAERHLATLTTLRPDGSPHVVPVGFTLAEPGPVARVITRAGSAKVAHARAGGRAVLCQVDGRRWLSLEGAVSVSEDPDEVAAAVAAYARRYRPPAPRTDRVVVAVAVDRVLGLVEPA